MSLTNCRFYEEKYPEVDSFVMVNVKQVRLVAGFLSAHSAQGGRNWANFAWARSPRWAHT